MQIVLTSLFLLATLLQTPPSPNLKQPKKQTSTEQQKRSESNPTNTPAPINSNADCKPCTTNSQSENNQEGKASRYLDTFLAACIAIFTLALVVAVSFQIRDYRTRERAWMLVEIESGPFNHAPDMYRIVGVMRNLGESPARILGHEHRHAYLQRGEQLPPEPIYLSQSKGEQTDYPLSPNGGTPLYWTGRASAMDEVTKGERMFYLFGRVEYEDIFDRRHETRYCFRYYPPIPGDNDPHIGFFHEGPRGYNKMT